MDSTRRTATMVGALFLTAMGASVLGGSMVDSVLDSSDSLAAVDGSSTKVIVGVLLELANCAAVVGIAVLLFPILRRHSQAMAFAYVSFRVIEAALLAVAAVIPLALVELGQTYPAAADSVGGLGTALQVVREQLFGLGFVTFFCLGAFLLYSMLFATRLTPRFIAVWGLVGVVAVFAWNVLETFGGGEGTGATVILALPIITNEIFLGTWLIARGFNKEPVAAKIERREADELRWESA
jgi:MFS family permease